MSQSPQPASKHSNSKYALEEYKMLQARIPDWGKQIFVIRGWLLAAIAGLTIAHLSGKFLAYQYLIVSLFSIVPLLVCELWEAAWQRKAIERVGVVEKFLRESGEYDGPKINL